jgi:hypothetical protein
LQDFGDGAVGKGRHPAATGEGDFLPVTFAHVESPFRRYPCALVPCKASMDKVIGKSFDSGHFPSTEPFLCLAEHSLRASGNRVESRRGTGRVPLAGSLTVACPRHSQLTQMHGGFGVFYWPWGQTASMLPRITKVCKYHQPYQEILR